jgi:hypothetical protein
MIPECAVAGASADGYTIALGRVPAYAEGDEGNG